MKETKTASASSEARAAMHEMMAAFEAFKGANDARLDEIEKKASADALLEEKVARIDQAVAGAQARLDRALSESRRPMLGAEPAVVAAAPEAKAAWDGYMKSGQSYGLELKAGLSSPSNSAGYVVPPETERAIERRLMAGSPMREIATVRTVGSGVFRKPVSTAGVTAGWVAETAARPETDPATLSLLDDALIDLDEWLAAEVEDAFAAQETAAFVSGEGGATRCLTGVSPPPHGMGRKVARPNIGELIMSATVSLTEAKLFLRVEHEAEDGLQTLIDAVRARVEGEVGLSLASTSTAVGDDAGAAGL